MPYVGSDGKLHQLSSAERRHDEAQLAQAILDGSHSRPDQAFGDYFVGRRASCALGAAYEGIYHLPLDASGIRPKHLERLFDCLEYSLRSCPEGCRKRLPLGVMILHLNDDHHWSREAIALWVSPPAAPSPAPR